MNSIHEVFICLEEFGKYAGPKLNFKKTKGIWLGKFRDLGLRKYNGIIWTGNPVKCLGVHIGHNFKKCEKLNWHDKIDRIEQILHVWSRKKLSLFGKVSVLKIHALSKIVFSCTVLKTPDYVIKKLDRMMFQFIWGRKDRVKRECIKNEIIKGGLNMLDVGKFVKAQHANWVTRYFKLPGKWRSGMKKIVSTLGLSDNDIISMNFNKHELPASISNLDINNFYMECILSFYECKARPNISDLTCEELQSLPLFGNYLFKIDNKCLFFKEWIKSKVIYINDVIDENGSLKSTNDLMKMVDDKRDIITQLYLINKYILKNIRRHFVFAGNNLENNLDFSVHLKDNTVNLFKLTSKQLYKSLCHKRTRNMMEKRFSTEFSFENNEDVWSKIYCQKIKEVKIIKLKEFNFKVLNNIVPCGYLVSKWKENVSEKCQVCNNIENTKHMLFECNRIYNIWNQLSESLEINIEWKQIVTGLFDEELESEQVTFINLLISTVIYTIFKHNSHCKFKDENYASVNILSAIKYNLVFYGNVWKELKGMNYNIFTNIIDEI